MKSCSVCKKSITNTMGQIKCRITKNEMSETDLCEEFVKDNKKMRTLYRGQKR